MPQSKLAKPAKLSSVIVLSTRSQADAEADCAYLTKHNITAIPAPVLAIQPREFTFDKTKTKAKPFDFDAVIFTSRHAPAAFVSKTNPHAQDILSLPCYAVGDATAQSAKLAGFTSLVTGSGDGKGLVTVLGESPHKTFCWASAEVTGFDIKGALEKTTSKRVEKLVVYEALPIAEFNADALKILRDGKHRLLALIHSGRTGGQFRHLLDQHAPAAIPAITLIVASREVARHSGQGWHSIYEAPAPSRHAMLALAVKLAAGQKQKQ